MTHLSYQTAYHVLKNIPDYISGDFDEIGISQENFALVTQDAPWKRPQIHIVMRTMNALLFSTCEIMGLQKIVVPSEYVAALVASVVAPANRMHCCIILASERATGVGALELSARAVTPSTYDPTSADHLFALVLQLSDTDTASQARKQLMANLNLRIEEAERGQPNA